MAKQTFVADISWSGDRVRSSARIRGHEVTIDEPAVLGGTDLGPNPVELVLAALGGCLNVLITSLAPRHGVEVRGVEIRVEGDLDPDGFQEKQPNVRPGFQEIRYQVHVESPSAPELVRELLAHVERVCPVKDTLRGVPTRAVES
ncbi:peroxiredoxin [Kyrpidia spormannii]|uniref:Peroxiredoxin n=1 Tax=Kyrpidia spormannii TaxID=2055160 RepID=A0A2K8N7P1_9BACL|nr:OsmC family protein [Kyrpidia spormannii]ATY85115.1 peroxiredoxin [Kyrpidia spormannii]